MPDVVLCVAIVTRSSGEWEVTLSTLRHSNSVRQNPFPPPHALTIQSAGHLEVGHQARAIGLQLFDYLIARSAYSARIYEECWDQAKDGRIWIALDFAGCPDADTLPWELICDPTRGYLALNWQIRLLRNRNAHEAIRAVPLLGVAPFLGIGMNDAATNELHLLHQRLVDRAQSRYMRLRILQYTSPQNMARVFRNDDYGVVMLAGRFFCAREPVPHAMIHPGSGPGRSGMPAAALAAEIAAPTCVRMVVLRATPSVSSDSQQAIHLFAQELMDAGIPSVLLLPAAFSIESSLLFLGHFLPALVTDRPPGQALVEGRRSIQRTNPPVGWALPVLYTHFDHDAPFFASVFSSGC